MIYNKERKVGNGKKNGNEKKGVRDVPRDHRYFTLHICLRSSAKEASAKERPLRQQIDGKVLEIVSKF